jgi:Ca2+-transporting ATPase
MSDWYTQKIPYLLHEFKTDLERGLSREEASAQQRRFGSNQIQQAHESSLFILFLKQFSNLTVILLFVVICIFFYFQHAIHEALVLFAILCFHILWRFIQKGKMHYQLRSIKQHLEMSVSVIRGGTVIKLPPTAIVPGDLFLLAEGDYIAADARIVDANALLVDETSLFGTTTLAEKTDEDISAPGLPPEKQRNMVFAGTYVLEGEARAIVVATSKQLEINNPSRRMPPILDLDSEVEVQMGIFHDHFRIAGGIFGGAAIIAALLFQEKSIEENWSELLFLGLGFVIASIPEGVVSTSRAILAEHAYKLLGKGVAIRNLINLERLSGVTAVCIDEIGNFTRKEMTASHVFVDERLVDREIWEAWLKSLERRTPNEIDEDSIPTTLPNSQVPPEFPLLILLAGRCAGNRRAGTELNQTSTLVEASIDNTLKQIAEKIGFDLERYDSAFTKIDELPQMPERPYKTLVFAIQGGNFLHLMFGDAEAILQACHRIQLHGTIDYMSVNQEELTRQAIQYLSDSKTQVFALAYRNLSTPPSQPEMKRNMTFLGLIAFTQLEHPDSKKIIQSCLDAGLKIVTITEKSRNMASDIAKELGIIRDTNAVVAKEDLDEFSDAHYESIVDRLLVYCRPSPEQKLNIVQHLKRHEHRVGFWGKSPQDLRAMRVADVSCASASHSSHVVQQHAACLVLKDGFHIIADLLLHVRESYLNLRSSMRWLLSSSLAQLITLIVGGVLPYLESIFPLLGRLPAPLTLLQIIWVHLLINLIPLMGLGHDRIRGELRYIRRQEVPPFLSKPDFSDMLLRSLVITSMTIFSFVFTFVSAEAAKQSAHTAAQTAACTTLIFTQLVSNFQCHRHFWESVFQRIKANLPLFFTILACMALHLAIVYLPTTQQIFSFSPLFKAWQWILPFCGILTFLPLNLTLQRR